MTKSQAFGVARVRPQIRHGVETGHWFVDVPASLTSNGKRKRKLFDNKTRAVQAACELRKAIDSVTGLLRVREKQTSIHLDDAINGWMSQERLRVLTLKKRQSTLDVDKYRMKTIRRYFGNEPLHLISEKRIVEYQAHRLQQGRVPVTINSELAKFRLVMRWAKKEGFLKELPSFENVPSRPVYRIIPTPDEVVRVIMQLPPRLQPIVRFLAETGCRRGEAINLKWDCLDEIGGYVEIRSHEGWTPKTQSSERRIPLNPDLLELIRQLPKTGPYVFCGQDPEEPVGEFKKSWKRAVLNAKIMRKGQSVYFPLKNLRKAHATWQAERGVSESILQGLLGHARGSRVTQQFYVHVTEEAKRAAVITLPIARNKS
jgi:integrase